MLLRDLAILLAQEVIERETARRTGSFELVGRVDPANGSVLLMWTSDGTEHFSGSGTLGTTLFQPVDTGVSTLVAIGSAVAGRGAQAPSRFTADMLFVD